MSFEPSNSKRMPLNEGPIFETLSRAQNSMYSHLSNKRAALLIDFWAFAPPARLFLCNKSLFFM
jgi:hypothetical protein